MNITCELSRLSHSYKIEALQEQGGELAGYDHFGEIEYTEQELEKYWNAASGAYEGIPVGGWSAVSSSNEVDMTKLEGASADPSLPKEYVGLEVGHEYAIGVSSAVRMTKDKDKNENMHYAKRTDSALKLLPIPVKPKLAIDAAILAKGEVPPFIEVTTNKTEQTLELVSDQPDIALEAWYGEQKIGTVSFDNSNGGSRGALRLDQFKTDGTYAVELRAANGRTKDTSVTMLYVTVDTIAPVLYLDEPLTGARTSGGYVTVAGTTTVGADLTVNGTVIKVTENGQFSGQVMVSPDEPTVELAIVSRDKAGNENKAIVTVTNDQFQVPVALVFKNVPVMSPGQKNTMRLEPYLRVKDGKDAQGKPKFKDVAVSDKAKQRVAYSLVSGDAVSLDADGSLTALARGSALIQADYR
ncbi:MAG: hypothetical protein K0R28_1796, partial [Paenibacillus sp.]|nr:hypothetical protein [Paenibacillus sp.]